MVRAVLFDLDDTLFDHRHCARCALAGVREAQACLQAVDLEALERQHADILETLHLEVVAHHLGLDDARVERFRRLYAAAGAEADAEAAARTASMYRQLYLAARREISGATALLREVQKRATAVVVSNNLLQEQQAKLRHCGLAPFVDLLVVSEEVGVSKPDPRIFEVALERAGCTAGEAVMIGDSWTNDVEGARAAGIRAIWFDRDGGTPADTSIEVVRSLEPTADVLAVIFGGQGRRTGGPAPTTSRASARRS